MPVTLAALPLSILYTRAVRDMTPLAGWNASGLGRGTGREGEEEEASNRLATGLQHACNFLATMAMLRHG